MRLGETSARAGVRDLAEHEGLVAAHHGTKIWPRKSTRAVQLDWRKEPVESAVLAYLIVDVNQRLHGLITIT